MLETPQRVQEQEYITPYHWFWSPDSESGRVYFRYLAMVAERIPINVNRLADLGCGDGRATAFLKDALPHVQIVGMDYSERALQLAQLLSSPRAIEWRLWNIYERYPDPETRYDAITAIEIFEHLPPERLPQALKNIRSVLRDGGFLILTVPSVLATRPVKHYQHFTEEKLRALFQEADFVVEKCDGQERAHHIFFFCYKFVDNRWWTIKPLMKWMNAVAYPRWVSPSVSARANRLIVVVRAC